MESLAYLHLAEAYEDPNRETREIVLFKALDWQKINSRWIQIVSLLVAISLISFANAAWALEKGDRGADVVRLQDRLKQQGFFPGSVESTGYYGSITQKAVRDFQQAFGLTVDGIAGSRTLEVMYGFVSPTDPSFPTIPQYTELRPGTRGTDVTKLQQTLQDQGFYPQYLSPNGYYDFSTEDAVRKYQDGIGLTPSGIADRDTLALLYGRETQAASAPIQEVVVNPELPYFPDSSPVASVDYIQQPPVFSPFPSIGGDAPPPNCRRVETISGRRLNQRSQPTTASSIIGKIPNGSIVQIADLGSNGWVRLLDGSYVSADYLKQCF